MTEDPDLIKLEDVDILPENSITVDWVFTEYYQSDVFEIVIGLLKKLKGK